MLKPVLLPSSWVTVMPDPPFDHPEMVMGTHVVVGTGVGTVVGGVLSVGTGVGTGVTLGAYECVGTDDGKGEYVGAGMGTLVGSEMTPSTHVSELSLVRYQTSTLS